MLKPCCVFQKQQQDAAVARQGHGWPFGAAAEKFRADTTEERYLSIATVAS